MDAIDTIIAFKCNFIPSKQKKACRVKIFGKSNLKNLHFKAQKQCKLNNKFFELGTTNFVLKNI